MSYELAGRALYPLAELLTQQDFPLTDLVAEDDLATVFDGLYYTDAEAFANEDGLNLLLRLAFDGELRLTLPGLAGVSLVAGSSGTGWTSLQTEFVLGPGASAALREMPIALRIDRSLLQPMRSRAEVDPDKPGVEILLGELTLSVDASGPRVDADVSIDLPLCMVGESGVVVEAQDITLHLDDAHPAPGQPAEWRGIHLAAASLYLPGELGTALGSLTVQDAYIGSGGFSGAVSSDWDPARDITLGGFRFELSRAEVTFVQNALIAGELRGKFHVAFFDAPLEVTIGLSLNGGFVAAIDSSSGSIILNKPGVLEFSVESVRFAHNEGSFAVVLSGEVTPLVDADQGFEWPSFRIQELVVGSNGNVHVPGGWLDVREQKSLDFHGFRIDITQLGFGNTPDGGKWIGFSGGVKLVDGLPAGASVEGLRITWYEDGQPPQLSLNGVGVEFAAPNVLRFKGAVSYRGATTVQTPVGAEIVQRFDGAIKLDLISLGMQLDATLVVGAVTGARGRYNFFAVHVATELPAGIPLFST
ncbi:MAG: hypothetical protein M3O70_18555, partial [Actinomycetota bacterium]|nr:hypothetical protein [Actinomycetota bacterium]